MKQSIKTLTIEKNYASLLLSKFISISTLTYKFRLNQKKRKKKNSLEI